MERPEKGVEVRTAADLAGHIVAVQADTTSRSLPPNSRPAVSTSRIRGFKLATDAFAAVKAGHADVIVVDEPVGRFYVSIGSFDCLNCSQNRQLRRQRA